ncbi:hypothetical protein [Chroococcidiopsis sp. SAG 2025]|uniref:hypothetical protein n=1 Tax=Chroococcidiopsis sp. SAG 2025 TaxID=171389 RepID=UPI0029374728|nr:hypothetical protein [Chroococcidiopsis sp. SAG 2025]
MTLPVNLLVWFLNIISDRGWRKMAFRNSSAPSRSGGQNSKSNHCQLVKGANAGTISVPRSTAKICKIVNAGGNED